LWYNAALFDEKGWSVPAELGTWGWDDFKGLAAEIRGEGLYPILAGGPGNAGTYWWAFYLNFVYQIGGDEQFNAMDSLTPGAWNNEVMIMALQRAKELFDEDIIDSTWSAIDWGDATTLSLQDQVGFNPDGQWHVGSNRDRLPEGYSMAFAPTPTLPDVQGSPSLIQAVAEPAFFVPLEADMPFAAMEYLRLWDSLPVSADRLQIAGDFVPISGAGAGAEIHEATASLLSYFNQAERYYNPMHHVWYAPLRNATNAAFTEMALGNISAQEAADLFEESAQAVRDDGTITIHERG
jgi:ABC-type glycerol-3-phosphate transport system substrate-binding protein